MPRELGPRSEKVISILDSSGLPRNAMAARYQLTRLRSEPNCFGFSTPHDGLERDGSTHHP